MELLRALNKNRKSVLQNRRQFILRSMVFAAGAAATGCSEIPMERLYAVDRDQRYGPHPGNLVDIWRPRFRWSFESPGVLLVHGGGWRDGSRNEMLGLARYFLQHGLTVANVEYRKSPGTRAPGSVVDVRVAATWFQQNAKKWGLDQRQMLYCGTSAGAHLALMAGLAPDDAGFGPAPRPLGVVNLWGVSDVAALMENPALAELLRAWLPPVASVEMAKRCSPLTYVRGGLPKVLHVHSRRDEVVPYEQSTRLHEALQAAGNASQLVSLDHGGHSTADWNAVDDAVGQFLNTTLVQIE